MKVKWKPGTLMAPLPAVLVSCRSGGTDNLMTAAWSGIVCSDPPMAYVSVRPERFSHRLIKDSGVFCINLTTSALARATDLCGVRSGRDGDKFALSGLTREESSTVDCPGVKESPVVLECRVKEVLPLGSHDMFLAEITAVNVEETLLDKKGRLMLEKAGLIAYSHGGYFTQGKKLGSFGFSVKKKR